MLKIKFTNGLSFEYLEALETEEFYNGSSRRTLTITASANAVSVDTLNTCVSNEANTVRIVLTNIDDETKEVVAENIYEGYVLNLSCGTKSTMTSPETPETPATYETRLVLKLGKRTYIEQQLHNLGL